MTATDPHNLDFSNIYNQWYAKFVTVARRYVRDRAAAEDIVTDAIVRLWEDRDSFQDRELDVPAWLFTVVRSRCLNWLDTQKRHLEIENRMNSDQMRLVLANITSLKACEPEKVFSKELRTMVVKALESMPDITREVFLASRDSEKTYGEISESLGISRRKVTFEIQKALRIMRDQLGDYLPLLPLFLIIGGDL